MIYRYRGGFNPYGPTGDEAAALLGVSRRTVYRWIEEGRLPYPLTYAGLAARPGKRRRGPQRRRYAVRYVTGRHGFTTPNWQKAAS